MTKLILTDVDEVVLNWRASFEKWCLQQADITIDPARPTLVDHHKAEEWLGTDLETTKGYIERFHHDGWFEKLEPYVEASIYIPMLANLGYRFVAITAIDVDPSTYDARLRNLRTHFDDLFAAVHCVGLMGSKREVLGWYRPTYWVEDKPSNAKLGAELGHTSFLISHPNNLNYNDPQVKRVSGWKDIYNMLSGRTW